MDIIAVFNKIRDLPYHCPESIEDNDYRCWGKHRLLYEALKALHFEVRYRVCEFLWSEQRIPKIITDKAPTDLDQHLYVEVKINKQWIRLDCSHDKQLPAYNKWDGITDCVIAVKYQQILSPEKSKKEEQEEKMRFQQEFPKYKDFFASMNKFLDTVRAQSP